LVNEIITIQIIAFCNGEVSR